MDPVHEHDPTMDAHIVHAVNVNNKKEVAEMRFLTKSLANARHVQESIYRQEEKDLLRQLWKLHKDKERRHPEIDYASRRSGHGLQRLSSDQIEDPHSSRRGSYNVLYRGSDHLHIHPASPRHHPHQRVHDDRSSFTSQAGEISQPTTSYHYRAPARSDHYYERDHGSSNRHIPFSGTSSHHFNPELFVHHLRPEVYPQPPAHRRHLATGYQPPTDIPGVVLQSSRLNVVLQPAGYGHSISEHAAHLGMHKHHHRGMPYYANHRQSHAQPSQLRDNIRNIGSYESMTRYITLLDCQVSDEGKKTARHAKGAPRHQHHDKDADEQGHQLHHPGEIVDSEIPGRGEHGVEEVIEPVYEASSPVDDNTETEVERTEGSNEKRHHVIVQDDRETKTNGAKPKSIVFTGVPPATPSPITERDGAVDRQQPPATTVDTDKRRQPSLRGAVNGHVRSSDKVVPAKRPGTKHPSRGKEAATVRADVTKKKSSRKGLHQNKEGGLDTQVSRGEVLPQGSSHHKHISTHPPQHQLSKQILEDLHAIATRPSHHNRHSHPTHHQQHHPDVVHTHHHHPHPRHPAPITAAERKRLAVELLAREYPVLLRHAPTKFDPLDALMCRYLRLSSTNVETLEAMCKDAGIEVGAHAHHQVDDATEYVFGHK